MSGCWDGVFLVPRVIISRTCTPSVIPLASTTRCRSAVTPSRSMPGSMPAVASPANSRSRWRSRKANRPWCSRIPLPDPVPHEEAGVEHADLRLVAGHELAVDVDQHARVAGIGVGGVGVGAHAGSLLGSVVLGSLGLPRDQGLLDPGHLDVELDLHPVAPGGLAGGGGRRDPPPRPRRTCAWPPGCPPRCPRPPAWPESGRGPRTPRRASRCRSSRPAASSRITKAICPLTTSWASSLRRAVGTVSSATRAWTAGVIVSASEPITNVPSTMPHTWSSPWVKRWPSISKVSCSSRIRETTGAQRAGNFPGFMAPTQVFSAVAHPTQLARHHRADHAADEPRRGTAAVELPVTGHLGHQHALGHPGQPPVLVVAVPDRPVAVGEDHRRGEVLALRRRGPPADPGHPGAGQPGAAEHGQGAGRRPRPTAHCAHGTSTLRGPEDSRTGLPVGPLEPLTRWTKSQLGLVVLDHRCGDSAHRPARSG